MRKGGELCLYSPEESTCIKEYHVSVGTDRFLNFLLRHMRKAENLDAGLSATGAKLFCAKDEMILTLKL